MRFRSRVLPLLLGALALRAFAAQAHEYSIGKIVIGHPWSHPTADGMPMGVAYFTLTNHGDSDALLSAQTPVAASVEFHQTSIADGMARMRPLTQIDIAAGATVRVKPGGIHLMLVDLKQPLVVGTRVPLTLTFRVAGKVEVQLQVE